MMSAAVTIRTLQSYTDLELDGYLRGILRLNHQVRPRLSWIHDPRPTVYRRFGYAGALL